MSKPLQYEHLGTIKLVIEYNKLLAKLEKLLGRHKQKIYDVLEMERELTLREHTPEMSKVEEEMVQDNTYEEI